jgi:hypothetical protein
MEGIIFAFLGSFLLGAAQGVVGNLETPLITAPARYVRQRLSAAPAAAQLVQREVAVALLRATGVACREFRRQIRSASKPDRRALKEWFYKADDFIINETARARQAEPRALPAVTAPEDAESVDALRAVLTGDDLDRPGVASSATELAAMMEAYLASHLGPVPDQFHDLLVSDWPMSGMSRTETTGWFQTATALFNHRLRSDETLRTAVTNLLLTDLSVSVDAVTTAVADHSSEALSRIGDVMASLSELRADLALQSESVARIERWVSKLLDVALLQELPGDRAVTVPDVLEALRRDAARSPRGRWAMDRSEKRVNDKAAGFVGREEYLDELDDWLDAQVSGTCVVAGRAGSGKSSLLAHWIRTRQGADVYFAYHFFSQSTRPLSEWTRGIDNLIRQLRAYREDGERAAGPDRPEDELYDLTSQDGMRAQPLVIVIDAVEESDQKNLTDLPFPKQLPDNVYVVVSVQAAEGESPRYLIWAEHLTVTRVDLRPPSASDLDKLSDEQIQLLRCTVTVLQELVVATEDIARVTPLSADFDEVSAQMQRSLERTERQLLALQKDVNVAVTWPDGEWIMDFSAARNLAQQKIATLDWHPDRTTVSGRSAARQQDIQLRRPIDKLLSILKREYPSLFNV